MAQGGHGLTVLIVDEIRVYRECLAESLRCLNDGIRVATAERYGISAAGSPSPDVVLVRIDAADCVGTIRLVAAATPAARVVVLGVGDSDADVVSCAEAGAVGYVARGETVRGLRETIDGVLRGEARCAPRVVAALLRRVSAAAAEPQERFDMANLTQREQEVLALIERGMSNKQIGRELCIEVRTVKNHVHNLLEKLRVQRRGEAAAWVRDARAARPAAG